MAWAISKYDGLITSLKNAWDYFWNTLLPQLRLKLDTLFNYKEWLRVISALLHPSWLQDVLQAWNTVKQIALEIASNPIGFMLNLLWSVILEFIAYRIAYALGTTKYKLPSIPIWGGRSTDRTDGRSQER